MRYTAVFEFFGEEPQVGKNDGWKGGTLCSVSFADEHFALNKLRELAEAIADGDGDAQEMAIQTLELLVPNVELTGAARLYRAASSDRRERG